MFSLSGKRILVLGARGLVGSALVRRLQSEACDVIAAGRAEADLVKQADTHNYIRDVKPDAVLVASARVGGIHANNSKPAEFLYENMMIAANVTEAAHQADVNRLVFLGSNCIYPKFADQPIEEASLLTGALEPTNEGYAIAKIAGIKLASTYRRQYGRDYISAMPPNLYGTGDNYDLETSHVLPALVHKAHLAKINSAEAMTVWGTGTPRREFLHVDDCADAIIFLLQNYSGDEHVNIGMGKDISIKELTELICEIVGFEGDIVHDLDKPDGTPKKLMSTEKLNALGWKPKISLRDGISKTYQDFLKWDQHQHRI